MTRARNRGFTLIELMIGLAVFAFLILIAGPQYADFLGNSEIRNGAENTLSGIQLAHAEAIRNNRQAKIVFDPTPATGGWTVYRFNDGDGIAGDPYCPTTGSAQWCMVQSFSVAVGAARTDGLTTFPAGATTVLFNGLGQIIDNANDLVGAAASATVAKVDITNSNVSAGNRRPLRVIVQSNSAIKLCDPAVAAGDPRFCTS